MNTQYNPQEIEKSAQVFWAQNRCFQVTEDANKEKFYCLSMFPYPSGYLHMGHVRNYTIGDVISRYQRMLGKNVLQPMGWDAFGLPAENAAIQNKIPPAQWTYKNIAYMHQQLSELGFAFDWDREIATCDPSYYRWEQWFFLKLYAKGLVYKKNAEVNWDPVDQTVLANEQVVNGRGWRSGALVERRAIPQWFFKITAYADELLQDLDKLVAWPEQVKTMQRNWIGRSEGIEIQFAITHHKESLTTFTTRPDTLFGITYIAIAPQHPLAKEAATNNPELQNFLEECRNIKVAEAELATLEKRGMTTGLTATHPITHELLPIWVANFVVMDYGTGALMAVPAHDQRDFEFAKQYNLPIKQVIVPNDNALHDVDKSAFTEPGTLINSGKFSELDSKTASKRIMDLLEGEHNGKRKINYRLRDWGVSRQRYWGTPIPMINCVDCGAVPVADKDLPVVLPVDIEFTGITSPLKTIPAFYQTTCPQCGKAATRETDTFDTFFESSWYYARFACSKQDHAMLDEKANYWAPVDQYIGGIEHAVMHLLYARFIHKTLRDEGLLKSDEPFIRLLTQGMVLNQGVKMSKSKGNTVDPQSLIERYGADTVRLFVMFAAPPEQSLEWSDSGVEGAYRFLKKVWSFANDARADLLASAGSSDKDIAWNTIDPALRTSMRQIYNIIDQIQFDYERLQFNTVVSSCMKLFNILVKIPEIMTGDLTTRNQLLRLAFSLLLRMLAPITPHMTHELWHSLQFEGVLIDSAWPKVDAQALIADEVELVVQVNGKLRTHVTVASDADDKQIEAVVLQNEKVRGSLAEKTLKKVIVVKNRLVNLVVV
jgi:leucyl-tRNA synthetase